MNVLEFAKKYHTDFKISWQQEELLKVLERKWRNPDLKISVTIPRRSGFIFLKQLSEHHREAEEQGGIRSIFSDVDK